MLNVRRLPGVKALVFAVFAAISLAGCSNNPPSSQSGADNSSNPSSSQSGAGETFTVGFLLPENVTPRFEQIDRPVFEKTLTDLCSNCKVLYANAQGDATKQNTQVENMISQNVNLLVIMAVDSVAVVSSIQDAVSRNIPVVAYERYVDAPLTYAAVRTSFELGSKNGDALLAAMTANGTLGGTIVAINGDPATAEVDQIVAGWHSVLDGKVVVGREYDTVGWDPAKAQTEMEQAITALGGENIAGVMVANDGMAGGAIAALKSAGVNPLPPVTGMDAEVAAVQRIIAGEQVASVYNDPNTMAKIVAGVVAKLATGEKIVPDSERTTSAGVVVPIIKVPLASNITMANIKSDLIDTGVYDLATICTPDFAAACKAQGLT